jgi:hypothetical protein
MALILSLALVQRVHIEYKREKIKLWYKQNLYLFYWLFKYKIYNTTKGEYYGK